MVRGRRGAGGCRDASAYTGVAPGVVGGHGGGGMLRVSRKLFERTPATSCIGDDSRWNCIVGYSVTAPICVVFCRGGAWQ